MPVWLPAMTRLESPATVMLRMATPTSGTSSQLQELAVRSHTLMLPCWSPVPAQVCCNCWLSKDS